MIQNIPSDLKAEILLGYLPRELRHFELRGTHKRNAYEDVIGMSNDDRYLDIAIARNGMYDILPECLFHPIDRFDNIPANEYKERFREECELQQAEEENARKYFSPFDSFLMEVSTIVSECKNDDTYSSVIIDVITDRLSDEYKKNRFVKRALAFIPYCSHIRGNMSLFTLMLRNILFEEGISVAERYDTGSFLDIYPRYEYTIADNEHQEGKEVYLGNEFDENVLVYTISLWKAEECNEHFLNFVSEMRLFEAFLNDFFMGIETKLIFNISTHSLPVRLSDDIFYTYLDYNTNI